MTYLGNLKKKFTRTEQKLAATQNTADELKTKAAAANAALKDTAAVLKDETAKRRKAEKPLADK